MSHTSGLRDFGIRKPVVPSLAAAQSEFNLWLRENSLEGLYDKSGAYWQLAVELRQGPSPSPGREPWYKLVLAVKHQLDLRNLCAQGVLSEVDDARLIRFLEGKELPCLQQKIGSWEGSSLNDIRAYFYDCLHKARVFMSLYDFAQVKRKRLGAFLDRTSLFGSRVPQE